ncbi:MAG: sodium:solute symporter [Ferruginibacter sp.]
MINRIFFLGINAGSLHMIDYIIVALSVIIVLYFALRYSKDQNTTEKFYIVGRKIPNWVLGFSLLAAIASSITFLAYPGAGYAGNWILLVQGFMVTIVLLAIIWFIVPLYRNVIGISAYEYFERRFGYFARLYGALGFVAAYLSKMGTIMFLTGTATYGLIGVDPLTVIWIIGILIIVVTLFGGMEGIIWLELIQGFLKIAAGLAVFFILIFSIDGGIGTIINVAKENNRIDFGTTEWNFVKLSVWVMAINGIFFAIQNYGTNQLIVQRFLTAQSSRDAIKSSLMGILLSLPLWALFMFIGTGLFVYYKLHPGLLPEGMKPDEVFPWFIIHELPVGVAGLVISGLIAAAFSSVTAELNSISAVLTTDFYGRAKKGRTDKQKLFFGKLMVVLAGIVMLGIASVYTRLGSEGALGLVFMLYSIVSGGVAGMFLLGLFSTRANKQGLYIGMVACILFTAYAVLTSTSVGGKLILDLGDWNFTHHKYMLGVYSHIVVLVVGYLASLCFKPVPVDPKLIVNRNQIRKLISGKTL